MKAPKPGEIYEKNGLRRIVVKLDVRSDEPHDVDVLWRRPDSAEARGWDSAVWLRYWNEWARGAQRVES